jgi:hypothetical protein
VRFLGCVAVVASAIIAGVMVPTWNERVVVPMCNGVDSLSVAAAAVAFRELTR